MINLKTKYMGLELSNPIVASSSGLTGTVNQIVQLEKAGVGAVVLKSLFEEQITNEVEQVIQRNEINQSYPEAEDYLYNYIKQNSIQNYLDLIKDAKSQVAIPVIASINCNNSSGWTEFAQEIEKAGADGIELNIFSLPTDRNKSSEKYEQNYIDILRSVKSKIKIPVSVKISPYFTNIVRLVDQLHANGAAAVVLFNRFYEPDIDLEKLELVSSEIFSKSTDIRQNLRWTGIVKGQIPHVEIAASTGIHDGETAVKQLLAGAQIIQLCSVLYIEGLTVIPEIKETIEHFMKKWNFKTPDDFRGRLSSKNIPQPELYIRSQFMKYFSNYK